MLPYTIMKLKSIAAAAALMMCGCAPQSMSDGLEEVRAAIDRDDFVMARAICDELYAQADTVPENLGGLSIAYMTIASHTNQDDALTLALTCYQDAIEADSARAASYFDGLTNEELSQAQLIISISKLADAHDEIPVEPDSIPLHY